MYTPIIFAFPKNLKELGDKKVGVIIIILKLHEIKEGKKYMDTKEKVGYLFSRIVMGGRNKKTGNFNKTFKKVSFKFWQ